MSDASQRMPYKSVHDMITFLEPDPLAIDQTDIRYKFCTFCGKSFCTGVYSRQAYYAHSANCVQVLRHYSQLHVYYGGPTSRLHLVLELQGTLKRRWNKKTKKKKKQKSQKVEEKHQKEEEEQEHSNNNKMLND
jgi:NADH:ubiquinone oxidoreductase subunit B-like Fe-S oxidoreductase